MTAPNVQSMAAGREMDALVAEKVMGIRPRSIRLRGSTEGVKIYSASPWWRFGAQTMGDVNAHGQPLPYSTDIAAAWLVVERMKSAPVRFKSLMLIAHYDNRALASFDPQDISGICGPLMVEANGEHAVSLAICRAALVAVGVA